jgi:hypothetical protein
VTTVTASGQCLGNEFETRVQKWPPHRPLYRCTTCDRVFRTQRPHPAPHPNTRSHDRTMQSLFAFSDVPMPEFTIVFDADGTPHTCCPSCGVQDEIKEVDRAIRWNTLILAADGKSAEASTGDGDYEGEGYICTSCITELEQPTDFEITDWY